MKGKNEGNASHYKDVLDPFYYKIVRNYINKDGEILYEVSTIEFGVDVYYIIDVDNNIIFTSSNPASSEKQDPLPIEKSPIISDPYMDTSKTDQISNLNKKKVDSISKEEALLIINMVVDKFKQFFKQFIYTIIDEKKFPKFKIILDCDKNPLLLTECMTNGLPGLKAYLIRELFKNTVIKDRGFKILFFLPVLLL